MRGAVSKVCVYAIVRASLAPVSEQCARRCEAYDQDKDVGDSGITYQ